MSQLRDEVMRVDALLDEGKPLTSEQLADLKAHLDRFAPSQADLDYLKVVRAKLDSTKPSDGQQPPSPPAPPAPPQPPAPPKS